MDTTGLLNQALKLHQQGQLDAAQNLYLQLLSHNPTHFNALQLLGSAFIQKKMYGEALPYFERALSINSKNSVVRSNYGICLEQLNRFPEAIESYTMAVQADVNNADAYDNRGGLFRTLKRYSEALGDRNRAILIDPRRANYYVNRGLVLHDLQNYSQAISDFDRAIEIQPDLAAAYFNRGNSLKELAKFDEALLSYQHAIAINPQHLEAHMNSGWILNELRRFDEALVEYLRALAIDPSHAGAHFNCGCILSELNRYDEARASYDRAIALDPDHVGAHNNRATLLLLTGNYSLGWEDYEWRMRSGDRERSYPKFPAPAWRGKEDIRDKTLLIYAEQGLGDTLQFCRYLPMVSALGAKIIFLVPAPLKAVMATLGCPLTLMVQGEALPNFDFHCPLMSLPLVFKTSADTIPGSAPYLHADTRKVSEWKNILGQKDKPRVGLVWNGGVRPNIPPEVRRAHIRRDVPVEYIYGLNHIGVDFYSLQKGDPAESEIRKRRAELWPGDNLHLYTDQIKDFSDTAALSENLDLIISADTSTAHLAAAIGKPVWLLNRYDTCWRWGLGTENTPWYPTLRIFRQPRHGDWESVIGKVNAALKVWLTSC